ncbi:hypothetical protein LSH36_773g00010 [Paralvinella palmiformis]|uniref:Uncharacterized protein n=1 Tax=Paralvinella palmiformis TaxID=53620 RepID=A0AAD9J0X7_9ANNE|nr:hypothetical protein LSH36_773g00010 [Paralvinella palmiformis]
MPILLPTRHVYHPASSYWTFSRISTSGSLEFMCDVSL